jgi:hypothetical protein
MKFLSLTIFSIVLVPFAVISSQGIYGFNYAYVEKSSETHTTGSIVKTMLV